MADDGGILWDVIGIGFLGLGAYSAYVYKDEILNWIDSLTGGGGGCTKTCPAGQHLVASSCTCVPNGCTKTCPAGQHIDANCNCVTDGGTTGGNVAFTAAGDWGSGRNNNWQGVVAEMRKLNPNVVLIPGDMSYTNESGFEKVTNALKALPSHPVVFGAQGNHDGSGYASLFNMYSNNVRNVGNCSFMSLNSNSTSGAINYFKANAAKMTQKWKIVFFHHPVYTVKSDHGATMGGIQAELAKAHVNLCIAAHNHNYQRFAPIGGVTHIVSGLGGESPYPVGSYSGTPANVKKYNSKFGTFFGQTSASAMTCRFIAVGGAVIDSFTI